MNRHSKLYGNDPATTNSQSQRGQRVFCSNRGQRRGCGGTFSIFLAEVLPRHTVRASLLWQLLCKLLAGFSIKAGVETLRRPLALESFYHLLWRWRRRLDEMRARLCQRQRPPDSSQSDPLVQTVEHLQNVFKEALCPVSEFQMVFQQSFLG